MRPCVCYADPHWSKAEIGWPNGTKGAWEAVVKIYRAFRQLAERPAEGGA
jgi:hypothetical protein